MRLGLLAGENVLSFSPLIFRRAYGLSYEVYSPTHIDRLKEELTAKGWIGFNVTTPYKEAIFPLLDEKEPIVEVLGAVNTVAIYPDGRWRGYNTDYRAARYLLGEWEAVYGGWEALLILGTGGAARAVAQAWKDLFPEAPLWLVSRNPHRPLPYPTLPYTALTERPWPERLLLVQATPLGAFPAPLQTPPFPLSLIQPSWTVVDLIYNPNPTRFLTQARTRGAAIESGFEFLRRQAEYSRTIWDPLWKEAYASRRKAGST